MKCHVRWETPFGRIVVALIQQSRGVRETIVLNSFAATAGREQT